MTKNEAAEMYRAADAAGRAAFNAAGAKLNSKILCRPADPFREAGEAAYAEIVSSVLCVIDAQGFDYEGCGQRAWLESAVRDLHYSESIGEMSTEEAEQIA